MSETLMTKLEAVNKMLATIGESPVSTLSGTVTTDVQMAVDFLNENSRAVQSESWSFNHEYDVTLQPDINEGTITLPGNCIGVKITTPSAAVDVVQRGLDLYDRLNHTYIFTQNIDANITYFLAWEELPELARRYIMIKSARIFQARVLGSETLNGFTSQEEVQARTALLSMDDENSALNIFNNYDTASMLHRRLG
jgi:hypothetical protein